MIEMYEISCIIIVQQHMLSVKSTEFCFFHLYGMALFDKKGVVQNFGQCKNFSKMTF